MLMKKLIEPWKISEKYNDNDKLIAFGVIQTVGILLVLCLLCGIKKFTKIKKLIIVKKRYPNVIYFEGILALSDVLIYFPVQFLFLCHFSFINNEFHVIISRILYPIQSILGIGIMWCEGVRLWIMFYQLKYINSIDNGHWKSEINSNDINYNFYIHNKVCMYRWNILIPIYIFIGVCCTISSKHLVVLHGLGKELLLYI